MVVIRRLQNLSVQTLLSVLVLLAVTIACAKTSHKPASPAAQNGSFGLVPLRNAYVSHTALYDDDAAVVENSLRLRYALVQCSGPDGPLHVATLQQLAALDADKLRRDGQQVAVVTAADSMVMAGCSVFGNYTLGPAALTGIFKAPPTTEEMFLTQQSVYLAARGARNLQSRTYSTRFYDFLAENAGATPADSYATVASSIERLDLLFNPCIAAGPAQAKFDKTKYFKCQGGSSAGFSGDTDASVREVSARIDTYEAAYASALPSPADAASGLGLAVAGLTRLKAANLKLSGKAPGPAAKVRAISPNDHPPTVGTSPAISALRNASVLPGVFAMRAGAQLAPVVSMSNPRAADTPPKVLPAAGWSKVTTAVPSSALALAGRPVGNTYYGGWYQSTGRTNYYYRQVGGSAQSPVFESVQYYWTSQGTIAQSVATWTYHGTSADGLHVWQRAGDSAFYHADAQGDISRVTTNAGNAAPGTGTALPESGTGHSPLTGGWEAATDPDHVTTPADPSEHLPTTPGPATTDPVPVKPEPVTPAPVTPAPVTPEPVTPEPVTPEPVTPAPVTPAPVTPAPVTPAPVTPEPVTPAPVTPAPVTPEPVTPAPVTPAPVTPEPVTPAPVTPAPVTPEPAVPKNNGQINTDKSQLGWTNSDLGTSASEYLNAKGNTLPNYTNFDSGVSKAAYTYGTEKPGEALYNNGRNFNCQSFTAAEVAAWNQTTGGEAWAIGIEEKSTDAKGTVTWEGHSVPVVQVGTNDAGEKLYATHEAQTTPEKSGGVWSKPFTMAEMPAKLIDHFKTVGGAEDVKVNESSDWLKYDPKKGPSSAVWDEGRTPTGEVLMDNGSKGQLFNSDGSYNFPNVPNKMAAADLDSAVSRSEGDTQQRQIADGDKPASTPGDGQSVHEPEVGSPPSPPSAEPKPGSDFGWDPEPAPAPADPPAEERAPEQEPEAEGD